MNMTLRGGAMREFLAVLSTAKKEEKDRPMGLYLSPSVQKRLRQLSQIYLERDMKQLDESATRFVLQKLLNVRDISMEQEEAAVEENVSMEFLRSSDGTITVRGRRGEFREVISAEGCVMHNARVRSIRGMKGNR